MAEEGQVCPHCGAERRPGAQFCFNCGTTFVSPPASADDVSKPRGRRWLAAGVVAGVIVLAGAGAGAYLLTRDRPESKTVREAVQADQPPEREGPEIQTSLGRFVVDEAEVVDGFPPGCDPGPACQMPDPGYQILIVWVTPLEGSPGEISSQFIEESKGAYVTDSTGTRTDRFAGGLLSGRLFVGFTPEASGSGFVLTWPGNPPISLDLS